MFVLGLSPTNLASKTNKLIYNIQIFKISVSVWVHGAIQTRVSIDVFLICSIIVFIDSIVKCF